MITCLNTDDYTYVFVDLRGYSKEAAVLTEVIIQVLLPFKQELNTLTADNGKEFSHHGKVSKELDVQFYPDFRTFLKCSAR